MMTAYRLEKRLGPRQMVLFFAILIPAGYISLGFLQSMWALAILFIFYVVRGIASPVLKDYIHRLSAIFLIGAGAYLLYYWVFQAGLA